jgi:hypothetical protein
MTTPYKFEAITVDDVPVVARMSADAFRTAARSSPLTWNSTHCRRCPICSQAHAVWYSKVANADTGNIMGYCNWEFHGFAPEEMPVVKGRTPRQATTPPAVKADNLPQQGDSPHLTRSSVSRPLSTDFQAWIDEVMPAIHPPAKPIIRCLFVIGLIVASEYQGRGVGSALVRWGTDLCDKHGVFAWVHSSEPAWPMYAKSGFEVVRTLDVNLDEYAPAPPPIEEGPGAVWGHYVFRYMKHFPEGGIKQSLDGVGG